MRAKQPVFLLLGTDRDWSGYEVYKNIQKALLRRKDRLLGQLVIDDADEVTTLIAPDVIWELCDWGDAGMILTCGTPQN